MPKVCQIVDRRGHVVERAVNENGTVPLLHGEALRVPMWMMDGNDSMPLQRANASDYHDKDAAMITNDAVFVTDATRAKFVVADALGRTDRASLNRDWGSRFLIPIGDRAHGALAVQRLEHDQARREMIDSMSNAWRGDPAGPETGQRYAQPTYDAAGGTLFVNVLGSFIIGGFAAMTAAEGPFLIPPEVRIFVMVGLCGGYTTFSSFSLQTYSLWREGEWLWAGANSVLSLILCLTAVWLGHILGEIISR